MVDFITVDFSRLNGMLMVLTLIILIHGTDYISINWELSDLDFEHQRKFEW